MNVVTVLRSGGIYTPEWVRKASGMLANADRFVCLTDMEVEGVETRPLMHGFPGWWSKMELFRPGALDAGRWVFFDLDTVILGDVTALEWPTDGFWMCRDAYFPTKGQSCVMAFDPAETWQPWANFGRSVMGRMRGDQDWLRESVSYRFLHDALPGVIYSLRADKLSSPPAAPAIINLHGDPKPHDPQAGWAHDIWASA